MSLRTLLACLTLSAATAVAAGAAATVRLGEDVAPTAQSVELKLDPAKDDYSGRVAIDLEVKRPTLTIRFHVRGEKLTSVALTDAAGKAVPVTQSVEGEIATLTAVAPPLAAGQYRLAVDFTQDFNRRAVGLYRADFEGQPYLFTQMEAIEAREAFPCWDEPGFKIPWSLTLEVPEALTALSNMAPEKESTARGWRRTEFAQSPPMPSYLVAIAVGTFDFVPVKDTSIPTRIVTARGQAPLAAVAARETPGLLRVLEAYFGRPYPYTKLDLIAVPEFAYGAMENPGLITFSDAILLSEAKQIAPQELAVMVEVIAHEIAHMWYGDLVTMQWWDDLWLNEAFADWMADKVVAQTHPELESALVEIGKMHEALSGDALASQPPIRPSGEATPEGSMQNVGAIYDKGSAVLAMIEGWIGEDAFRQGVLQYLSAHTWKNATGPDLWRALGKAASQDVEGVLTTFISQSGAPLVEVEAIGDAGSHRVRFAQSRYAKAGDKLPAVQWRVPLGVRYRDDGGVHTWTGELAGPTLEATLPGAGKVQWLLPNTESLGYYRWAVPEKDLENLVAVSAADLSPRERIGLVGNLRAVLDAGHLGGDRYLALIGRLLADPEPTVQRSAVAALEVAAVDLVPPRAKAAYAEFLREKAGPLAHRLGFRPTADEKESVRLLRPPVLSLVGEEGDDEKLRGEARKLAEQALVDPEGALDSSVIEVVFDLAAHDGDRAQWDEYRRRYEAAQSPGERFRYLYALAQFSDPELVRATLDYALTEQVRPTELPRLLFALGSDPDNGESMFSWTVERWDEVARHMPPFSVAFMPYTAAGCSAERAERATRFFADPKHQGPGTELQMAKVNQSVAACVRLREREGAAVERWLKAN